MLTECNNCMWFPECINDTLYLGKPHEMKCIDKDRFEWSCYCCALKLPKPDAKFCQCEDDGGSMSCFHGDSFILKSN